MERWVAQRRHKHTPNRLHNWPWSDRIPTDFISMPHNFASVWKIPFLSPKLSSVSGPNGTVNRISNELSASSFHCSSLCKKKKHEKKLFPLTTETSNTGCFTATYPFYCSHCIKVGHDRFHCATTDLLPAETEWMDFCVAETLQRLISLRVSAQALSNVLCFAGKITNKSYVCEHLCVSLRSIRKTWGKTSLSGLKSIRFHGLKTSRHFSPVLSPEKLETP